MFSILNVTNYMSHILKKTPRTIYCWDRRLHLPMTDIMLILLFKIGLYTSFGSTKVDHLDDKSKEFRMLGV